MSLNKVLGTLTEHDVEEVSRIARKKSIHRVSKAMMDDLDREMLSKMISAYMVLKANGHTDSDFVKYLTTKETKKVLKLGFGAAGAVLPSLLLDGEFRSLVMKTRKQMKRQKEEKEEEQRTPQKKLEEESDNVTKVGPVTVKVMPEAVVVESPTKESNS